MGRICLQEHLPELCQECVALHCVAVYMSGMRYYICDKLEYRKHFDNGFCCKDIKVLQKATNDFRL